MRPMPASPLSAISPAFGPTKWTPSARSVATFRCVAGCAHIAGFIAGASSTGASVGKQDCGGEIVGAAGRHLAPSGRRSPARRRSASASRARRMWPTSCSSSRSNSSVKTLPPVSAPTDSGVTNSCAAFVITARTVAPALAEPADQVERLVGGDAAADDEKHGCVAGETEGACAGVAARPRARIARRARWTARRLAERSSAISSSMERSCSAARRCRLRFTCRVEAANREESERFRPCHP